MRAEAPPVAETMGDTRHLIVLFRARVQTFEELLPEQVLLAFCLEVQLSLLLHQ